MYRLWAREQRTKRKERERERDIKTNKIFTYKSNVRPILFYSNGTNGSCLLYRNRNLPFSYSLARSRFLHLPLTVSLACPLARLLARSVFLPSHSSHSAHSSSLPCCLLHVCVCGNLFRWRNSVWFAFYYPLKRYKHSKRRLLSLVVHLIGLVFVRSVRFSFASIIFSSSLYVLNKWMELPILWFIWVILLLAFWCYLKFFSTHLPLFMLKSVHISLKRWPMFFCLFPV